jgi:hypothetical protein
VTEDRPAGGTLRTPGKARHVILSSRTLLIIAVLFSGLLAGGNIDRSLVAMPAWQEVGATAWTEFSRHADRANGLILYPLEAFGGALFSLLATVRLHFDGAAPRATFVFLYAAVLLAAGGLIFTLKAAPIMLGIRDLSDPAALQNAFEAFWYWGNLPAGCQVLSFFAQLGALAVLLRGANAASLRAEDAGRGFPS